MPSPSTTKRIAAGVWRCASAFSPGLTSCTDICSVRLVDLRAARLGLTRLIVRRLLASSAWPSFTTSAASMRQGSIADQGHSTGTSFWLRSRSCQWPPSEFSSIRRCSAASRTASLVRSEALMPGLSSLGDPYIHGADLADLAIHDVARLDALEPLGRAGHDDVAGIEGIEARGPGDQLRHVQHLLARIGVLPQLVADPQREVEIVGIGHLVGRHQPGSDDRIGVDALAKARILLAAQGHVEPDRIAGDMAKRLFLGNVAAFAAD